VSGTGLFISLTSESRILNPETRIPKPATCYLVPNYAFGFLTAGGGLIPGNALIVPEPFVVELEGLGVV
jgi:hypothetical protein